MRPTERKRWIARVAVWLDVAWLLALALYIAGGTSLVPFHGDESMFIAMSRAPTFAQQASDPQIQQLRMLNGTLPVALMRASWRFADYPAQRVNGSWVWGAGWDWNRRNGRKPDAELLALARMPQVAVACLSLPMLFLLGLWLGGRPAAYTATFLIATHPVALLNLRRATLESGLFTASIATVFFAVVWLRAVERRGAPTAAAVIGFALAAGLAVASKHSGLVPVAASFLVLGTAAIRKRSLLVPWLSSGLLALGIFIGLNPTWWSNPVARPSEVLALRQAVVEHQLGAFPGSAYEDLPARVAGLTRQLSTAPPVYAEIPGFGYAIAPEIRAYAASPWRGLLRHGGNVATAFGLATLGFCVLGCFALLRHRSPAAQAVLAWGGVLVAFTLLAIPLAWQRYYLPLLPVEALLAAAGFAAVANRIQVRKRPATAAE